MVGCGGTLFTVQLTGPTLPTGRISARSYGAKIDGTTDDRTALNTAVAGAKSLGADLFLPDGTYKISKYIDVGDARGLRIFASGDAVIRYASADTDITSDSTALSDEQARSALLLRTCSNVVISGLTFVGDDEQNITTKNVGCGIYATQSVGTVVRDCAFINGGPFVQDALVPTVGTGDSLSISGTTVTLEDADAVFSEGQVARRITISGATNPANNGTFLISGVPDSTSVTFTNPAGIDETSSFRWSLDDADRATRIESCKFFGCRRSLRTGHDAVVRNCHFEHPMNCDATGRGSWFQQDDTTTSLVDRTAPFKPSHVGKWITIAGATTAGNNGRFQITSVDDEVITYENEDGAAEPAASATTWWIMNGDKTGTGNGTGSIAKSGTTVTFTADEDAFHSSDVGKVFRICGASNAGNNSAWVIASVPAANQVTFENASAVVENFAKGWSIDAYDNGKPTDTYGSTHMIYLFAGRSNVLIEGCTFRGARTTCVKVSGSTLPVHDIIVRNCVAEECASFCVVGADDTQEHSNIAIEGNQLLNCGNGRQGWSQSIAMEFLGCRGLSIRNNKFHYTRNAISKVDGRDSTTGLYGIRAARYIAGVSQPLEDVAIEGNTFTSNGNSTSAGSILATPIVCDRVGQRAYFATAGTLTKVGDVMTLTHSTGSFGQSLVGCSITLVNAPNSGNNGTFTVTKVGGSSTLSFVNSSGTGGGVSAGTYRIKAPGNRVGGGLLIKNNQIHYVGDSGIQCTQTVAPEIIGNVLSGGGLIECSGCVAPRIVGNREINSTTSTARIRLNSGTSWPFVEDNLITNGNLNTSVQTRDMGIGVDSGTPVDYPLLGKRGRCKPTQAKQEIVIAYGSGHVDGDVIHVTGTDYTYKASSPAGNQFNSFAGLVALIDAKSGHDCADYGAQFSTTVTSQHLRIRSTATSTSEVGQIYAQVSALNPTALVMPRNEVASSQAWCYGRGAASTSGTLPDRSVVWSLQTTRAGSVTFVADNEAARALLAAGSKAKGTITCVAKADLVDTDYLTIGDGIQVPKLYEFDTAGDGVTTGRVQVDVSAATDATSVGSILKAAIEANQPALSVTDNSGGALSLAHKLAGDLGNVTITENVANAGFSVAGFTGGGVGGYRSVKNGTEDPGACEVIQHAVSDGTEEFRWVIN